MIDRDILESEFTAVKEKYPDLFLLDTENGTWTIYGNLPFHAKYENKHFEDEYIVEILILSRYPNIVPSAKEVGGRIPKSFHTNPDNTLCLGAPIKVKKAFSKNPTLDGFIENCLVPYLFSHSFNEQKGAMPFGELIHGTKGIIQCYLEEFQTKDIAVMLNLLDVLTFNTFPGYELCPCQSGERLFKCHGDKIIELKRLQLPKDFRVEKDQIIYFLNSFWKGIRKII
jgi:hypothetical protein